MASVSVLMMMRMKMPYSKPRDVTNHQILYWKRTRGM